MFSPEKIVTDLYQAFFDRHPDPDGLRFHSDTLKATGSIEQIVASFMDSDEFKGRFLPDDSAPGHD